MTFKFPSPLFYLGSLLIASLISGLVYWILLTQGLTGNGAMFLGAGVLIGHFVGACLQPATRNTATTVRGSGQSTAPASDGETISLYVGNLAYRAKSDELRELFEEFGPVNSVRIMIDRTTRRPRGFAFVEMEINAAQDALSQLDNTEFCGRNLRVSEAKQRN